LSARLFSSRNRSIEDRGEIDIRSVGLTRTYFLEGPVQGGFDRSRAGLWATMRLYSAATGGA